MTEFTMEDFKEALHKLQYARVNEIEDFLIRVMKVDDQNILDNISPESLILMPMSHEPHFKHLPFVEFSDTIDAVFMVDRSIFYGLTPTLDRTTFES